MWSFQLLGLFFTTSGKRSILCLFYRFFASLNPRLGFKRGNINKRNKEWSILRSLWKRAFKRQKESEKRIFSVD